jgi:hypothetical protein
MEIYRSKFPHDSGCAFHGLERLEAVVITKRSEKEYTIDSVKYITYCVREY